MISAMLLRQLLVNELLALQRLTIRIIEDSTSLP
jgi:hypothetical protein